MPKLLRKLHEANEELVAQYLLAVKGQGKKQVSMLDLIRNVRLPVEQIESVMLKLEKEGKIREA